MKYKLLVILLLISVAGILLFFGFKYTWQISKYIPPEEQGNIEVHFCPQDNCEDIILKLIANSNDIDCAFYDLDSEKIINALKQKDRSSNVRLVSDDSNKHNLKELGFVKFDDKKQYMHNKFCIFDQSDKDIVSTGSLNPTKTGLNRNKNNLVVIFSDFLAKNYQSEFNELWQGDFGSGKSVKYPQVMFNGYIIENYFCPEDNCEARVINLIKSAKNKIYFMVFSFTSDNIGDAIIKKASEGIEVKGLFESFQSSEFSEYKTMKEKGINVKLDNDPSFLHHKVFIIDNAVIFGSYNPTKAGNEKNDENILIIHNKEITDKFLKEFNSLFKNGK